MFSVLSVVLPIFALIFAGWVTRRIGVLGPNATSELNRFVVYLALPALLFDIVAKARWSEIWQPGFVAAFGLGIGVVFTMTVALRLHSPRHLADATIDGLNAAYANAGFIGFPLSLAVLGSSALAPTLIATILTVCVLFAVALIMIEIGVQTDQDPRRMVKKVAWALVRNPLLAAPALGAIFLAFGFSTPVTLQSFLTLLGGAASPCALVALGLFLGDKRKVATTSVGASVLLTLMKLVVQPVVTWLLATLVFDLSESLTNTAVLLAALPTGTGPFMVAEFYHREAGITSRVVLISTLASLVTITLYLTIVHARPA